MVPEGASGAVLPPLPLDAWEDTKETLHRLYLGSMTTSST